MTERASAAARWLERIENGLIAVLVLAMVLLAGAQILLRNLVRAPASTGPIRCCARWCCGPRCSARWLPLATTSTSGSISSRISCTAARSACSRFIALMFAAVVCAAMAWYGGNLVMLDYASATIAFGRVPSWCVELILPVGFGLLALRLATHAFLPQRSDAPALAPELP